MLPFQPQIARERTPKLSRGVTQLGQCSIVPEIVPILSQGRMPQTKVLENHQSSFP